MTEKHTAIDASAEPPTAHASETGTPPCAVTESPIVGSAESGQKVLQFLQRRLQLPSNLLHRWIRTGQVRLNGRRCKAFDRVHEGDAVRLPPFALKLAAQSGFSPVDDTQARIVEPEHAAPAAHVPPLPPIVGQEGAIWALLKPAGLPTHGGTGHEDSVAGRLAAHYADAAFKPTPAHRLDKDTSGVLLVGASFSALRLLQDALRQRRLIKEYVVWVQGRWPWADSQMLRHHLHRVQEHGFEKMKASGHISEGSHEALCMARPLRVEEDKSLLLIRLFTGRTHQIRVQLSALGFPVLGDSKYGHSSHARAEQDSRTMYLHALRIILPQGTVFACLPPWQGPYALDNLPACMMVDAEEEAEILASLPDEELFQDFSEQDK